MTVGKWRACLLESGVKFGEDMIRTLLSTRAYMALRLGLLHILKVSPVSRVALSPATRLLAPLSRHLKPGYQPRAHRLSTMSSSTMTNSPMIGIIGMGDVSSKFAEWRLTCVDGANVRSPSLGSRTQCGRLRQAGVI